MAIVICNTPSCLIPKELFKEEKIHEYWNALYATPLHHESIGKDELENFFLLYPSPKDIDSTHEISFMYKSLREKFPDHFHAICINVHDTGLNLLALKDQHIIYTGYFHYSVKEDILYHLTNIFQQFFDNNIQVTFFYQQLSPPILRLLNNYYEMTKL
ncbi:MAG: DUF3822 family protein [Bacteroidetes bacterium]|nr:DUF3822 family protein [Bacteroidota bacterium]MCL2303661.1 DUF3822 family protein [Lentimicrobiaceae bacterium]